MRTVFDESFARVWHDNYSPIIFMKLITTPCNDDGLHRFSQATKTLLKKLSRLNKKVYAIVDVQGLKTISSELLCCYFDHFINERIVGKLDLVAVVFPEKTSLAALE